MITAKEIREVKFNRSLGGYKTTEVDEFLDRCADSVEELVKNNDENERKMQVLAETIMDYRNQEDSIRSALISAQRMSESVISDARKQADDIRNAAQVEAAAVKDKAMADIAVEMEELRRIRQEVADFKAKLLATYREHLTLIGILDDGPVEEKKSSHEQEAAPQNVSEDITPVDAAPKATALAHDMPDFTAFELVD